VAFNKIANTKLVLKCAVYSQVLLFTPRQRIV